MSPHRRSRLRAASAAWIILAALASPTLAQPTAEEAARLQAIGETYFGKPAPGEASVVAVVPEGDHYRASLDLGLLGRRLIALLPAAKTDGLRFEWGPMSSALAPVDGGLWRVWDMKLPKLSAGVEGQVTEVTNEGFAGEGLFDPASGAWPSFNGRLAELRATSTVASAGQATKVTSEDVSSEIAYDGTARRTDAPGVVDVAMRQTTGTRSYSVEITDGAAAGIPDMKIALTTGRQDAAVGMHGLRSTAILDLWAHLVAHHAPTDFTTGQGALKARIAAAVPLFNDLTQKVEIADIGLESPFGILKAAKATINFESAGVTRDGLFALRIGADGVKVYSLFMPKWAQPLVPSDFAMAGRVSGYDLATALSAFLESADFNATPPLTPEQQTRIGALLLPRGNVEIALDGNRIAGSLYAITLDGRLDAGPAGAKGAMTVKAKGLDAVTSHLARPDADAQAKALGAMIAQARQFAERKGEEHVWRFDFDGDKVAINGKPLK